MSNSTDYVGPKLKVHQMKMLLALSTHQGPWDVVAKANVMVLRELADVGLAYRSAVAPHGWLITEAGRRALINQPSTEGGPEK